MPRPPLAEHCDVCALRSQCSCQDCAAKQAAAVPVTSPAPEYAQVVGGALVKIPAGS